MGDPGKNRCHFTSHLILKCSFHSNLAGTAELRRRVYEVKLNHVINAFSFPSPLDLFRMLSSPCLVVPWSQNKGSKGKN